jgi:carbon storage regulator
MLVLSRKAGEKIVIPDSGVTITILDIKRNRVLLGITAPAETAVYREEVWQRMQNEEAALAQSGWRIAE